MDNLFKNKAAVHRSMHLHVTLSFQYYLECKHKNLYEQSSCPVTSVFSAERREKGRERVDLVQLTFVCLSRTIKVLFALCQYNLVLGFGKTFIHVIQFNSIVFV